VTQVIVQDNPNTPNVTFSRPSSNSSVTVWIFSLLAYFLLFGYYDSDFWIYMFLTGAQNSRVPTREDLVVPSSNRHAAPKSANLKIMVSL
jgi:hypothetical protein